MHGYGNVFVRANRGKVQEISAEHRVGTAHGRLLNRTRRLGIQDVAWYDARNRLAQRISRRVGRHPEQVNASALALPAVVTHLDWHVAGRLHCDRDDIAVAWLR